MNTTTPGVAATLARPLPMPADLPPPQFDENALRVLRERYFAKKPDGSHESPTEFIWRVASAIAQPERVYALAALASGADREPESIDAGADLAVMQTARAFYDMMAARDFMPNTPCLINAGRPLSMLSACFVLPVPDSMEGIFSSIKAMALIQKSGGGTGFPFSSLRASGSLVASTGKDASGPISFMKVFNAATDSIKQGGVRRGANMGVLRVDHPDVLAFIRCKKDLDLENRALYNRLSDTGRYNDAQLAHIKQELLQTQFNNFNISIGVTDAFMSAVKADAPFDLRDPRSGKTVHTLPAREIWEAIVEGAWQNGEPGVLFLDHPQWNPLPGLGPIDATNPCLTGETMLLTSDGPRRIDDLVGVQFEAVVDGATYASSNVGAWMSGHKPVFKITTDDGRTIRATANHRFMTAIGGMRLTYKELKDLRVGDQLALHRHAQKPAGVGGRGLVRGLLHDNAVEITSIEPDGTADVYDCNVPGPHAIDIAGGIYVANCGEQALHGWDACNLGSINVGHFWDQTRKEIDWERLARTTHVAIRFLDNVIDANSYPLPEIAAMVQKNRRVGLGIMGFADLLVKMHIPYGSTEAIELAGNLMKRLRAAAEDASETLAIERGEFPNKHLSIYADDPRPRRNVALLSIAPTGTISMIAGCSFGCEPYFGIAYTKHVMKDAEGRPQHLYYVLPLFEQKYFRIMGYPPSPELLSAIEENRGSLRGLTRDDLPPGFDDIFTVAADVTVDQHIDMLAAFQSATCNSVSKTINAPNGDSRENVAKAIVRAYESGCKGFTYYRDGSRTEQVVTFSKDADLKKSPTEPETLTPTAVEEVDSLAALLAKAKSVIGT